MPCHDDDHVFHPGTHAEVSAWARRGPHTAQTRRLWPCAWCHEGVDLVELLSREKPGGRSRPDRSGSAVSAPEDDR